MRGIYLSKVESDLELMNVEDSQFFKLLDKTFSLLSSVWENWPCGS